MDNFGFNSTNIYDNNYLNFSNNISCRDVETAGGKISKGFEFEKRGGEYRIKSAKCAGLRLGSDLGVIEKGSELNNVCDCEVVDMNQGQGNCPPNKFIKTYFPTRNKFSCCSPCSHSGEIKAEYNDDFCEDAYLDRETNEIICPEGKFATAATVSTDNARVKCCKPSVGGSYGIKGWKMSTKCKDMGIENCTEENINDYEKLCKSYGLEKCTKDEIEKIEEKCNKYGMRYTSIDGTVKNPESYLDCHQNNFSNLDRFCKEKGIKECNWKNIKKWKQGTINQMIKNMDGIEQTQEIYEEKFNKLDDKGLDDLADNRYFWILVVVMCCLLIITFVVMRIRKN